MAVSPLPSQFPPITTTGAPKSLAMRNIASQEPRTAPSGDSAASKPSMPEPELAEQLNADVRRKYVKGGWAHVLQPSGVSYANIWLF